MIQLELLVGFFVLGLVAAMGFHHSRKPMPPGTVFEGGSRMLSDAELLVDLSWEDADGHSHQDHEIFDRILALVGQARQLVLLDMFLFNDTAPDNSFRPLAAQLTDALIARKQAVVGLQVVVITDPINTLYGGLRSRYFERLEKAGVTLVETRLTRLRDTNPAWSGVWRLACQWLGNNPAAGWLPNLLGGDRVTVRSYLALLNFKANHRKTLVVDEGDGWRGLVTSANPHDGSSRHSNIGVSFRGPLVADLLDSERAVLAFSGAEAVARQLANRVSRNLTRPGGLPPATGQLLTESAIRRAALQIIDTATAGSEIDLNLFYLSHRRLVKALIDAAARGVRLRILLDSNEEAFGLPKFGIPNRQTATELHRAGVPIRWCKTSGEQNHTKLLIRRDSDGAWQLLLGSANFTRRNLDDLNLEASVRISGQGQHPLPLRATTTFEWQWRNGPEQTPTLSLPYGCKADESRWRYWLYRVMEATGLSTF